MIWILKGIFRERVILVVGGMRGKVDFLCVCSLVLGVFLIW